MFSLVDYESEVRRLTPLCSKLLLKLKTTSFFKDPASTKYHHMYVGGLADHSFDVYLRLRDHLLEDASINNNDLDERTISELAFLIGVGHDLDKIGTYRYNSGTNTYDYIPRKKDGRFHGENSYWLLQQYLGDDFKNYELKDLVEKSIIGHMALYERINRGKEYWNIYSKNYKILALTSQSDMESVEADAAKNK